MAEPQRAAAAQPHRRSRPARARRFWASGSDELAKYGVDIRYGCAVDRISGTRRQFALRSPAARPLTAEAIVLAIGLQGNLRKLGAPGDDLRGRPVPARRSEGVRGRDDRRRRRRRRRDRERARARRAEQRDPDQSQRRVRALQGRQPSLVLAAIKDGKIECRYGTSASPNVEMVETNGCPLAFNAKTAGRPRGTSAATASSRASEPSHRASWSRASASTFPNKDPDCGAASSPRRTNPTCRASTSIGALGRLSADQAGDEPGLRGGRVRSSATYDRARRRAAARPGSSRLLAAQGHQRRGGARRSSSATCRCSPGSRRLQLREFLLDSELRTPDARARSCFARNDYTNSFFTVVEGEVLRRDRDEGRRSEVVPPRRRQFFGELGLISGRRRSATVRAGPDCVLVETPRRSMLKLIASVESIRARDRRGVPAPRGAHLPRAGRWPRRSFDALVANAGPEDVRLGRRGAVRGSDPRRTASTSFAAARSPFRGRIGGREVVLSYVAAGNYVGEMALLTDAPRTATARPLSRPRPSCSTRRVQARVSRATRHCARTWKRSFCRGCMRATPRWKAQADSGNIITFLMQQGIGEATDVLLIDESAVHPLRQLREGVRRHA